MPRLYEATPFTPPTADMSEPEPWTCKKLILFSLIFVLI